MMSSLTCNVKEKKIVIIDGKMRERFEGNFDFLLFVCMF